MPKIVRTALGVATVEDIGDGIHRYWWNDHMGATDVCVTNESWRSHGFLTSFGTNQNSQFKAGVAIGTCPFVSRNAP